MAHMLICGMTESGKSTLACQLSWSYKDAGVAVIVLDPMLDKRWSADILTADRDYFLQVVTNPATKGCAIFVDESAEMIGHYNNEMFFLATRGRHAGHSCHFISQRAKQLAPTVRDQCSFLALFNCSLPDAIELSNNFNRIELREANTLKKGEYFFCGRFSPLERKNVDFSLKKPKQPFWHDICQKSLDKGG